MKNNNKKLEGGLGLEIGLGVYRVRDRVRAGGEWVILFEKHPPPPPPKKKKLKNHLP